MSDMRVPADGYRTWFRLIAGLFLTAAFSPGATITLTSSVAQSGVDSTIPSAGLNFTAPPGFDFTGQPYGLLASIQSISLTLTLFDADSALGDRDFNKLTLGLDGTDTGILLNGFPDSAIGTQTIVDQPRDRVTQQPSTAVGAAILRDLQSDGRLTGLILSTDKPSFNGLSARAEFITTLVIEGEMRSGPTWGLALDQARQSGAPGSRVLYSGRIDNYTGLDLTLESAFVDFPSSVPNRHGYSDAFLATLGNIPATGYRGPLFYVDLLSSALPGTSGHGVFELGVLSPGSPSPLTVDFETAVAGTGAVPEPGTIGMALAGFTICALWSRGHKRA